jgi:Tol biopolymer transport system component
MDIAGGSPVSLCDAGSPRGGYWSPEGFILFARSGISSIFRISPSGGSPVPITKADEKIGETAHYYPQVLPDGKHLLYLSLNDDAAKSGIVIAALDGKDPKQILQSGFNAHYHAGTRRLFYLQDDGRLMARGMTPDSLTLSGDATVVAEGVRGAPLHGYAEFSLSTAGDLFYSRGPAGNLVQFTWRDRTGKVVEQIGPPGEMFAPVLSPDGGRGAYITAESSKPRELWVLDLMRGTPTRITFGGVTAGIAAWSTDGKNLFFPTRDKISRRTADGSGQQELVSNPDQRIRLEIVNQGPNRFTSNVSVSSDGRWLAYSSTEPGPIGEPMGRSYFGLPKPAPKETCSRRPLSRCQTAFAPANRISFASESLSLPATAPMAAASFSWNRRPAPRNSPWSSSHACPQYPISQLNAWCRSCNTPGWKPSGIGRPFIRASCTTACACKTAS